MASYKDGMSTFTRAAVRARSRPEGMELSKVDAGELRARAVRYRQLADALFDPRVIAEVRACARALDLEASWVERQASVRTRAAAIQRYRTGN